MAPAVHQHHLCMSGVIPLESIPTAVYSLSMVQQPPGRSMHVERRSFQPDPPPDPDRVCWVLPYQKGFRPFIRRVPASDGPGASRLRGRRNMARSTIPDVVCVDLDSHRLFIIRLVIRSSQGLYVDLDNAILFVVYFPRNKLAVQGGVREKK